MSLTHDQEISLLLSGSVRLPNPAPATGALSIIAAGSDPAAPSDPADLYLKISHVVSARMSIARVVRLSDIRAAFGPFPPEKPPAPPAKGEAAPALAPVFFTDRELARAALEFARNHPSGDGLPIAWLAEAVLFLPESAPVLMTVEAGLSAAESAEYYPPLGRSPAVAKTSAVADALAIVEPHSAGIAAGFEAVPFGQILKRCHP